MRDLDRQIFQLAIPAFGALVAPALFMVTDAVIVGTLGANELAALGVGATVNGTVIALSIFLAYGTTASVGRLVGAKKLDEAFRETQNSVIFATGIGLVVAIALAITAQPLAAALSPAEVTDSASTYLTISSIAIPFLLVSMALTGALRGFQDTKATLIVSVLAVVVNTIVCTVTVLALDWGIAGSAWSTVIAEVMAVAGYAIAISRHTSTNWFHWRPRLNPLKEFLRTSLLLLWRTAMLRAVLISVLLVASAFGTNSLAAYHASFTIYGVTVFALDALAIAAQAMVSKSLGSNEPELATRINSRTTFWSFWLGLVLVTALVILATPLSKLFTESSQVRAETATALLVMAVVMMPASFAFAWDGVLIGASDFKFLAWVQTGVVLGFAPVLWWVYQTQQSVSWLWVALGWWLFLRCLSLWLRLNFLIRTNWRLLV
jgi:putative MATE family efflux protein